MGLLDAHEAGLVETDQDPRATARGGTEAGPVPAADGPAPPKAMSKIEMIRAKRGARPSQTVRPPWRRRRRPPKPSPHRPPRAGKKVKRAEARPTLVWLGDAKLKELADRINAEFGAGTVSIIQAALLVQTDKLVDVALFLRDKNAIKYDYLASLQSVHYEDCIEVNYQLDSTTKPGKLIELRVRTAEAEGQGEVPSLYSRLPRGRLPGARSLRHDGRPLHGTPRADAHPHVGRLRLPPAPQRLSRALLRGTDEGVREPGRRGVRPAFPRRGDQPLRHQHEGPQGLQGLGQPLEQRRSQRPSGLLPGGVEIEELDTDQFIVSMGPQHPSTHGVFRLNLRVDGETIIGLKPVMGYMHRNHEKIGERNTFLMNFPFTDRLDYLTSMGNNFGYALAVEQLMGDDAKPPERAEYIRVIMAELTRIASHMWSIGFLLNDLGAFFTPALYAIEERELILDLFEWAAGSRMMCNYFRFGGVAFDLPPGWIERCRGIVNDRIDKKIDELDRYLSENEIVLDRCKGVGVLTREQAINYSTAGPVLRASGVAYDIRRAAPYSIYDRFDFKVITGDNGDLYDRYYVRLLEMRESARILKQAVRDIPDGPILPGKKSYQIKVPAGEAYSRVENPKGELGYYVVADGSADGLSLPRAQPELHQPDRARGDVPGAHDRRRRRHPGEPRHRAGRSRSVRD